MNGSFRPPPPEQIPENLFDQSFYEELVKEMDPNQEITPEAIDFFNDIAHEFLRSVLVESAEFVKNTSKDDSSTKQLEIGQDDVNYILKAKFNMTNFPGGPPVPDTSIVRPTAEYLEKLNAIRSFSDTHRDD